MYTPAFITWTRKAGYVYTWLHHMVRKATYVYTWLHHMDQEGCLCVHLTSSHGSGRLAMCTPDFITWIRKAAYVYT